MKYTDVYNFAKAKHAGQVDKGGAPYFDHPQRVADMIWEYSNQLYEETENHLPYAWKCMEVALLHDILEDTDTTVDDLRNLGATDDIIEGVLSVTRNEGESYGDFVKRASKNEYGRIVKFFDLKDNLNITRLAKLDENDLKRLNKYLKWYHYLHAFIIVDYGQAT